MDIDFYYVIIVLIIGSRVASSGKKEEKSLFYLSMSQTQLIIVSQSDLHTYLEGSDVMISIMHFVQIFADSGDED